MRTSHAAAIALLALFTASASLPASAAHAGSGASAKKSVKSSALPANLDAVTSASIVPEKLRQSVPSKAFTKGSARKALFIVGDPRRESVEWDLVATASKHLIEKGFEVEIRDLYEIGFNPVLPRSSFYHAKDGFGKTTKDIAIEQGFVRQADYLVFCYPNWHDSPNAIVKGYMERVFSKKFAYRDSEKGLEGLLKEKAVFTIMNAGWVGMGRGDVGDGVVEKTKPVWDKYMGAYRVIDDDTAAFWGAKNLGRFVNDRTPANNAKDYEAQIQALRAALAKSIDRKFGL